MCKLKLNNNKKFLLQKSVKKYYIIKHKAIKILVIERFAGQYIHPGILPAHDY